MPKEFLEFPTKVTSDQRRKFQCVRYDSTSEIYPNHVRSNFVKGIRIKKKRGQRPLTCIEKVHDGGHGDEADEREGLLLLQVKPVQVRHRVKIMEKTWTLIITLDSCCCKSNQSRSGKGSK
jgi:hypothetical protein